MRNSYKEYAFESLDGGGKTTHIDRLSEELEALGLRAAVMASPGRDTWSGNILRANIGNIDPERANRLFALDILRSHAQIPPHSQVVLWDRYIDSVRISNTDRPGEDLEEVASKLSPIEKTIYLDITPEISWDREEGSSTHPLDPDWLRAKHVRYQRLLKEEPERFEVVDATKPIDEVYELVSALILAELGEEIESQERLHNLLLDTPGVVKLLLDNPCEVKPGVFLPMFINLKEIWKHLEVRDEITKGLSNLVRKGKFDWIVGLESGGSYYSVSVANELGLPVTLHRSKSKKYSDANGDFVGSVPPEGARVALIDDVYATGQSANRANKRVEELGAEAELFTIFSYSSDQEIKKRLGIYGTSLTYFKGLRALIAKREMVDEQGLATLTELVDIYRKTIYE